MSAPRRYPLAPLLRAAGVTGSNKSKAAEVLGTTYRQYRRWELAGGLTIGSADRAACHIDVHPTLIWPDFGAPLPMPCGVQAYWSGYCRCREVCLPAWNRQCREQAARRRSRRLEAAA